MLTIKVCEELGLQFGEQKCILLIDLWHGWRNDGFRAWVKNTYPWIRILYVPGACTSVSQPCDAGLISAMKGVDASFAVAKCCVFCQHLCVTFEGNG